MDQKLDLILEKLNSIETSQNELTKRVGTIEINIGTIETNIGKMESDIGNIRTELNDFRVETKTSLQIIQSGQRGTREEMTQRFNEVKHVLNHLESDISVTFHKTAQHELEINRIKKQ